MNEIKLENGVYKSIEKEDDPKKCAINLNKRIGVINNEFFRGNECIYDNWKFYQELEDDKPDLCICGHTIYSKFLIKKDTIICQIGNSCIKKFFPLIYEEVKKLKRKTEYCNKCCKNFKKNKNHGFCIKCKVDLNGECALLTCQKCFDKFCECGKVKKPEFKQCYECNKNDVKTKSKCRICRRSRPFKFFSTCKTCYLT